MKDIKIDTTFKKIQYWASWVGFVLAGGWIIALFLVNYGRVTSNDVKKQKGLLNMTWQKFVFVYGSIAIGIMLLSLIFF